MEMQIFKLWENGQSMNREKVLVQCVGGGGVYNAYIYYVDTCLMNIVQTTYCIVLNCIQGQNCNKEKIIFQRTNLLTN